MKSLPNPHDALPSLEEAIACGDVRLQKCSVDPTLSVTVDKPNGEVRLTYVTLEGGKVTALVMAVQCDPFESNPCFNIGYAVAANCRGQGRATEIVKAAIAEMEHGFGRSGIKVFFVEAIVGEGNIASIRVAEKAISSSYNSKVDAFHGVPIRQYLKKVGGVANQSSTRPT